MRDAFRSYMTDAVNVGLFQILHAHIATQKSHLNGYLGQVSVKLITSAFGRFYCQNVRKR